MRHLYLLIPVGSEEGKDGWKTNAQKAGDKSQEHHETQADPSPVSPKGRGFEVRISRSRLSGEPPTLQGPPIQSLSTGHCVWKDKAVRVAPGSPLTSSSVFCFLATIPVLRASLFPPLRLPTWVKGQKTARVTGAGPALGGAEAHYTFLSTPRPAPPAGRPAQQSERSTLDSAPALGYHAQAVLGPRLPSRGPQEC